MIDLLEAPLLNKYIKMINLRVAISTAVKYLISIVKKSAVSSSLWRPNINDIMRNDVASSLILCESTTES